jgi:hypothetical protein
MKNRLLLVTCLGLLVGSLPPAWGVKPDGKASLPDYDKRNEAAPARQALAKANLQREQAAEALKARLPKVQISRDKIVGAPRFISAGREFLTGPNGAGQGVSSQSLQALPSGDPHRVTKAFINEHSALFGHDSSALNSARVTRDYVTRHNGVRTVVWEQTQNDVPVFEGLLVSHLSAKGELVNIADRFVPNPESAARSGTPNGTALIEQPAISAARAVAIALGNIGNSADENEIAVHQDPVGREKRQTLRSRDLFGPAWAQLMWLPMSQDEMRLCWRVVFCGRPQPDRYLTLVDAETGEVLVRRSLTRKLEDATFNVFVSDSPSPFTPGWPTPDTNQPPFTNRTAVKMLSVLDTNASPLGWIYDGRTNVTFGNNADAYVDRDLDFGPDNPRPAAGSARNFNPAMDLSRDPRSYGDASAVQLFYRANWFHDRMYKLGFTEAAGNFQVTNFNRGGLDLDPVICLSQAGSDVGLTDNSAFMPAPDGIPGYCLMFTFTYPNPDRDGSLDQEVVIHELTHGMTDRLLGQGVGISALQSAGMGEGWSDFYAMALLSEEKDDVNAVYATGGYVTDNYGGLTENYYYGIRRYPYSTDMSKNPLTFKDIDPTAASVHPGIPTSPLLGGGPADEVHNMGEIWCMALWEVRANILQKIGWKQGNQVVLQLVTDGLKLAPANATYLEARDAIIQADQLLTGGSFYDEIWIGFAKRGMGYGAECPTSDTTVGVVESFEPPPDVAIGTPDGILEVRVTPASGSVIFAGDVNPFYVKVGDSGSVTNATVSATANNRPITFKNDGVAPDAFAGDSTYTGTFPVPREQTTITIPVVVSATNKVTSSNSVTYTIIPVPANDTFAAALKVPAVGGDYLSSNKRATLEKGEPAHGGTTNSAASLWWNYDAQKAETVLLDTGGSDFVTILSVYTGNSVSNLTLVATATGNSAIKGANLKLNTQPGVNYRIVVASANSKNLGTVRLNIAPGGNPDTSKPVVTVNTPISGMDVSTNRLFMSGSAVDPNPNPSGIKQIAISVSPAPFGPEEITIVTPPPSFGGPANTNWFAFVGLRAGVNNIRVSAIDYVGNVSSSVSLQVTFRFINPPNDFLVHAAPLTNSSDTVSANTFEATKEVGEPNHAGNLGGKSAWWSFTAPADGVLALSTTNSSFDTLLAVYTGDRIADLTLVGANDDAYPQVQGGHSELAQAVRAGQAYRIAVDGYDSAGGAMFLKYTFAQGAVYTLTASASDGGSVSQSSFSVPSNTTVTVSAVASAGFEFQGWNGDVVSAANPVNVPVSRDGMSIKAVFRPVSISDDFETGDLAKLAWLTSGDQPWIVQGDTAAAGKFAAKSGAIQANQTSSLVLTGEFQAASGSFDVKVSSEQGWDFLKFLVDGNPVQQWSGEVPWTTFAFPLSAGTHTLEWRYAKDPAHASGDDAAFIDNVILPFKAPVTNATPATLSLGRQTDGVFYVEIQGQPNQVYVVQGSPDFANWRGIGTNVAAEGVLRVPDPASKTNQIQFYRAFTPQ